MYARHVSTQEIAELIIRGEDEGWLPLSAVEELGDGLPQAPLEALYERLDAHRIEVRDDCSRAAPPLAPGEGEVAAATTAALWLFLGEIPVPPPLSNGEELVLAMQFEQGDRRARERMVNANLPLVVSIAGRYHGRRGLPLLDVIRAATLALFRAVETYEWRLGHRLSVYATWCVLQSVHRLERDTETRQRPRARVA